MSGPSRDAARLRVYNWSLDRLAPDDRAEVWAGEDRLTRFLIGQPVHESEGAAIRDQGLVIGGIALRTVGPRRLVLALPETAWILIAVGELMARTAGARWS